MNQKRPKIVFAHLLNNYTGSPQVLRHVIEAMGAGGYETVLHSSPGPGFLDESPASDRHVWYKWYPNKYLRLISFLISQVLMFCSLLRYWRQPVIIYANTILPFGAGLAAKLMGKKLIYHIHETKFEPPAFTKFLLKVIELCADRLIFVSDYLKEYHHFPKIPSSTIYNAIPDTFIQKTNLERDPSSGPLRILMICSLKKAKGIFEFIDLAQALPTIHFTLVISQTEMQVLRFLGSKPRPTNLDLHYFQADVHPFYRNADILLSLSHPIEWPETFGMTILEGMYYGLPSIVPTVGAPVELVREGIDGFHLDMRSLKPIVRRLKWLQDNPEAREAIGRNARERANDFSMESHQKRDYKTRHQ